MTKMLYIISITNPANTEILGQYSQESENDSANIDFVICDSNRNDVTNIGRVLLTDFRLQWPFFSLLAKFVIAMFVTFNRYQF